MNPGAPEDAHISVVLQHVQHGFGSVENIGYQISLVSPDATVNLSADNVLRQSNIRCSGSTHWRNSTD